jgi:hypothetical protein
MTARVFQGKKNHQFQHNTPLFHFNSISKTNLGNECKKSKERVPFPGEQNEKKKPVIWRKAGK